MFTLILFIVLFAYFSAIYALKLRIHFIETILLVVAFVIVSSITIAPDVTNYFIEYTAKYYTARDAGFYAYMQLFKQIGLNFYEFKAIHLLVCLEILFFAIKLITPNISCIILFYFTYPFFINIIQIRNFFILSIVILAFALLLRQKNKVLSCIVWISLVLLAASFHKAALAFLPFIFLYDKDKFLYKMMYCLLLVSVVLVFGQNSFFSTFMQSFFSSIDNSSRLNDVLERTSKYGSLYTIAKALLMIYITQKGYIIFEVQKRYCNSHVFNHGFENFPEFTKNLFVYSSLFWPLYVWGGSFMRLMQNEYILLYIFIFSSYQSLKKIYPNLNVFFKLNDAYLKILIVFMTLMVLNVLPLFLNFEEVLGPLITNLKLFYAFL